jgi:hypothetical protein
MKFLSLFVLSGLSAYFMGPYLPHWGLMLAISVLAAIVGGKGATAFFSGALAVGFGSGLCLVPYPDINSSPNRV